jgi:hypothetical protein
MDLPIPMWWAEFDAKLKVQKKLQETQKGSGSGLSKFSQAEWAAAKKRHKEKLSGNGTGA